MPQDPACHKNHINASSQLTLALIALGANQSSRVGTPSETLAAAIVALSDSPLKVEQSSRFFATPCFPQGTGPDYVNATVTVSGLTDPYQIMDILHGIEAEFGRERRSRWGQRCLDLDLIAVADNVLPNRDVLAHWMNLPLDQQTTETPDTLILPHPRLQDRGFVLVPLAEIAPDWVHPILGKSVLELRDALPEAEKTAPRPLN